MLMRMRKGKAGQLINDVPPPSLVTSPEHHSKPRRPGQPCGDKVLRPQGAGFAVSTGCSDAAVTPGSTGDMNPPAPGAAGKRQEPTLQLQRRSVTRSPCHR